MKCIMVKVESFDSDEYRRQLHMLDPESIFFLQNWEGFWKNGKLLFRWSRFNAFDLLRMAFIILEDLIIFRPQVFFTENTYMVFLLGWYKKTIYVSTDWLNHPLYKYFDFVACKLATVYSSAPKSVNEERLKYWKRPLGKEVFYPYMIKRNFVFGPNRNSILFLERPRKDSGLDIALNNGYFHVISYYPIPRREFKNLASQCFCGINLITDPNSHSSRTFPARIMEYLQFGLPPIITDNCGEASKIVRENFLGEVIEPTEEAFLEAVKKVYKLNSFYRNNIFNWLDDQPRITVREILESV